MQKNPGGFSVEDAMRLTTTPAGQQLIELLKRSNASALQEAATQAARGDMEQAKKLLGPLLASDEVKKLLQQLGG